MLVGDLIYNDNFDINCNFRVYDCSSDNGKDWSESPILYDNYEDRHKPLDKVLDMEVGYITIDLESKCLVIEAR